MSSLVFPFPQSNESLFGYPPLSLFGGKLWFLCSFLKVEIKRLVKWSATNIAMSFFFGHYRGMPGEYYMRKIFID